MPKSTRKKLLRHASEPTRKLETRKLETRKLETPLVIDSRQRKVASIPKTRTDFSFPALSDAITQTDFTKEEKVSVLEKEKSAEKKGTKKKTTKESATKTIGKFMKTTDEKRKSHFLKSVCSDSGMCIAVGKEIRQINKFFNHFTDFTYVSDPVKPIGVPSANGFIKEITYTRDGYKSYAILKSSVGPKDSLSLPPDNLMYEYEVGQYINKQNSIFSCFLETYGMFLYKRDEGWTFFKVHSHKLIDKTALNQLSLMPAVDYKKACLYSKYIAILIQHINKAKTFFDFINQSAKEPNADKRVYKLNIDTICILYQIYFTLDILKDEFTHYDLHADNVLLYEPVKNGYITYHYHLISGKTIIFHSKYIAKIIDYGRCYFHENNKNNSKKIYEKVCLNDNCPRCGRNAGFVYLSKEISPGENYYITSQLCNRSHDLKLANILKSYFLSSLAPMIYTSIKNAFRKIVYAHHFGTPERTDNGYPGAIHNVNDMRKLLEDILESPAFVDHNVRYSSTAGFTKIGDIHIYEDRRPMQYVKLSKPK